MSQYPIHDIHVTNPQPYAVVQERFRHDGALYQWGEYAIFVLMWRSEDFERGLVQRCPSCFSSDRSAAAYGQPVRRDCPVCFGTSFDGGYRAKVVRPSLWDYNEKDTREHSKGDVSVSAASIQTTSDFQMRTGDYVIRADNDRWQVRSKSTNHLRTGFETPDAASTAIGYNFGQASLEDRDAVSRLIPPVSAADVRDLLTKVNQRRPTDFSEFDDIRGPLFVE